MPGSSRSGRALRCSKNRNEIQAGSQRVHGEVPGDALFTALRFLSCSVTAVLSACLLLFGQQAVGQDLEPRRWTVMPLGVNVVGAGYAKTRGDIFVDPVLRIEDAEVEADSLGVFKVAYLRSETREDTGSDSDSLIVAWSMRY